MINRKKQHIGKKGFTLIETLLAVLILTTAVAGPLTIAAKGLQLALIAKDQITATYLAQDAMEYVRWIRDTNKLCITQNISSPGSCAPSGLNTAGQWLAGFDGTTNGHTTDNSGGQATCTSTTGTNACIIDSLQDKVTYCGTSAAACVSTPLYFDSTNKYFTYTTNSNTQTIFARTVQIKIPATGGNASEAEITVTVQWKDIGGVTRSVVLRENVLNWQ